MCLSMSWGNAQGQGQMSHGKDHQLSAGTSPVDRQNDRQKQMKTLQLYFKMDEKDKLDEITAA